MERNSKVQPNLTAKILAGLALVMGSGLLLLVLVVTWLEAFYQEEYTPRLELVLVAAALLLCVILIEWPWRNPQTRAALAGLRFAVLGVALLWLTLSLNTDAWVRWATDMENAVTESGGRVLSDEYMQGVYTLKWMADYALIEASLPLLVLILLAVIPGFRTAYDVLTAGPRGSREPGDSD